MKVGSTAENDHQQGIAHFLEHFVFLGTKKYSNETVKKILNYF